MNEQLQDAIRTITEKQKSVTVPTCPSVYCIQGEQSGLVKIGYAFNPQMRLPVLQSASGETQVVLGFIPGGAPAEDRIHTKFRRHRIRGEWFKPAPEIFELFGVGK